MLPVLNKIVSFGVFNLGPCDPNNQQQTSFFNFAHWWKYIHTGHFDGLGNCTPEVKFPDGIWLIALAVIDMLLYLAGLVAVVAIIVSGLSYIMSGGSTEKAVAARKRLINSIIGLVIVIAAVAIVSFIGGSFGG